MKRLLLFLLGAAAVYAAGIAIDYAAEGKLWWSHIQFLADDKLGGRDTGSEGYGQAVQYVSTQFERAGLKPAGTDGYQQPVAFDKKELVAGESSLELVRDGKAEPLAMGAEASLSARGDLAAEVEAPMVFVGYGMVIPEAQYDDLAGLDLKGKIAVYVSAGGPVKAPGNVKSHYSSGAERWAALRRAGAIGVATIPGGRRPDGAPPQGQTPPDGAAAAGGRGGGRGAPQPSVVLADKSLQESQGQQVAMMVTRQGAEKLFAGSGHTLEEITKLANANEPLPTFPLVGTLRAKAVVKHSELRASNVVGVVPGTDKTLKNEYVVMSAHLDHLGTGRPVNGDSIYNGAMDDASGIASVLEIARLMKATGVKPKRSIIFLAVTAEEKGELGSRYFAAHPTVPAAQIVADINLDMFLPLYALKVIEVQGLAESSLGETVRAAAAETGVAVQVDQEPEQNRFIRSDQYSFIRRGIPSLAFKFGYEPGSPDEKMRRDWVKNIYHKPADDLNQPIDAAAAARFDRIILNLLQKVADAPARPHWNQDSFFRRFAE
jgi:Peptidase family M28